MKQNLVHLGKRECPDCKTFGGVYRASGEPDGEVLCRTCWEIPAHTRHFRNIRAARAEQLGHEEVFISTNKGHETDTSTTIMTEAAVPEELSEYDATMERRSAATLQMAGRRRQREIMTFALFGIMSAASVPPPRPRG